MHLIIQNVHVSYPIIKIFHAFQLEAKLLLIINLLNKVTSVCGWWVVVIIFRDNNWKLQIPNDNKKKQAAGNIYKDDYTQSK